MNTPVTPQPRPWPTTLDESRLPPLPPIPRRRYLDEAFYQLELAHVFRKSWLFAGHASDFPENGSYRLLDFDLAPVVVVRGRDGVLRAFLNSCAHRGATVLKEKQGCARVMSCQYHGWTYDLQGRLVGVTQQDTFPHLDPAQYRLPPLRCESWGGLVFINFDAGAPPLLEWLTPTVVARYSQIVAAPLRVSWRRTWEFNCNWKLPVDAFREAYHIDTIHPKTVAQMIDCTRATIDLNRNGHDTISVPYRQHDVMANGEWDAIPALSGLASLPLTDTAPYLEYVVEPNLFPNLSLALQSVGFPIFTMWPIAVDRTRVDVVWLVMDWGDAPRPPVLDALAAGSEIVGNEDLSNLMSMQASLRADPDKGIPLATKEIAIYQLHAEIDRLIGPDNIPPHLRVPDVLRSFEH